MEKDLKLYEASYLISPAYSEEEAQNFHQAAKNHVQSLGGLIDHEGEVVKRRLSYPIKNMTEAHLASLRLVLAPGKIGDLKRHLASKEVLRFLLVQTKRLPPRVIRSRPANKTTAAQHVIQDKLAPQTPPPRPSTSIEEIDKKLEEILGK